ncbi:uncharacterized protein L3040_008326 [Drepanopeziza brunnea f. sp. 'multigermtubi']|uniref:Palmitoyltransferase n=1 Tax=Marssonina brunnea f. sp. multigermtubi (strain MB_m1) TaxID=1072389 RepID=K1WPM9_MARBU|nr:DHHC zinc finger membrane protein [Drepanopeziza brunnea f. sp. 'multigermtubi' MB_m1]EKD14322.1 DHHC zinc finger membrane protein [Drepanopeziza brunnea f. sp. 'multigermtubi' MB_m1]KAJ5035064.1 hypothetical protein L3040_008326 [Drepanopeziza brunnea f. sp. 'multigermtubi']
MSCQLNDPADAQRYNLAVNKWAGRFIPLLLTATVGYATYVLVYQLCVKYLLDKHNDNGAAIAVLVVYFILFLFMVASYFRLTHLTFFRPPFVPLGSAAIRAREARRQARNNRNIEDEIGGGQYNDSDDGQNDPNSPGLELFYSKDVFVCDPNGKPRWCYHCKNWKPDRAHHDSNTNRCVRRLDHFCPWVGGPVGENNMKFFIQFAFYAALYCVHLLVVMSFYIHKQISREGERVNAQVAVILGLAGFFGIFTGGIFSTSAEYAMKNKTLIEGVQIANNRRVTLAVIRPPLQQLQQIDPALASNPPYTVITYPLPIGAPLNGPRPGLPGRADPLIRNEAMNQCDLAPGIPVQNELSEHHPDPPRGQGAEAVISKTVMDVPVASGTVDGRPSQPQAQRDLMATRTFGILGMENFGNPWDLGSWHKNFRTIMGMNIVDWFFPVRMSPCCNHDSGDSQFALGPPVDDAKRRAGFLAPVAQVNTIIPEPAQQEKQRLHSKQKSGAQDNNNPIPPPQQLEKLDEQGRKQESTGNSSDAVSGT